MHPFRSLLTLAAAVLLFSFASFPVRTDYSGSWKLNESKSELGDYGGRFAPRKIKAEQKEESITIDRTAQSFNGGEATSTETISFDGKPSQTSVFGAAVKKSTAKWSDDGQTLTISYTITFQRNGEPLEITGTEAWSLSADGKTLTLQTVSNSPQGELAMKMVYDKE